MPRVTYADEVDLLLGEVRLSAAISKLDYLEKTASEIDIRIGRLYVTPIDLFNPELTEHSKLTLRHINAHLATGRIIMAQAIFTQDKSLHAYGKYMVDDALRMLSAIANDPDGLEGAVLMMVAAAEDLGPSITQQDATSPLDDFYGKFAPVGASWTPGGMP